MDPGHGQPPEVQSLSHFSDRDSPEVLLHRLPKQGLLAPAVFSPDGKEQSLHPQRATATPITRDSAHRWKLKMPPACRLPDTVDTGAAHHTDPVRRLRPGSQEGECVVVQIENARPAALRHSVREHLPLSQIVRTGEVESTELGDWSTLDTGFTSGCRDAIGENLDRSLQADDLMIRTGATGVSEQSPVVTDQRNIRLAVSSVHRKHGDGQGSHVR